MNFRRQTGRIGKRKGQEVATPDPWIPQAEEPDNEHSTTKKGGLRRCGTSCPRA